MGPKKGKLNKMLSKYENQDEQQDKKTHKMKQITSENQKGYENDMEYFSNFISNEKKQRERQSQQRILNKENNQNFDENKPEQIQTLECNECIVCLDQQFENGKYILNCRHSFCNECFIYWSNISKQCPACLKNSNSVLMILNGVSRVTNFTPKYRHEPCQICDGVNNEQQMYYCDQCQISCVHVYCQITLLDQNQHSEWICKNCEKNKLVKNKQYRYADELRKNKTYQDFQQFSSEYYQSSPNQDYQNADSQETKRNKNKSKKKGKQFPRNSRELRKR